MRTYIDQSRVSRDTDRKIHAADLEMNGLFVQMVPAIARKLARDDASGWKLGIRSVALTHERRAVGRRRLTMHILHIDGVVGHLRGKSSASNAPEAVTARIGVRSARFERRQWRPGVRVERGAAHALSV